MPTSAFSVSAITLVAMAFAAHREDRMLAIAGAATFAIRLISAAATAIPSDNAVSAIRQGSRFNALTLLWTAAALLIAYPIVGLHWRHGWQYALGAALIGAAFAWHAVRLDNASDAWAQPPAVRAARGLSAVLALAVTCAAGWLVLSGKLATIKNDWLANDVFLAAAASVFAVSVLAFLRARQT